MTAVDDDVRRFVLASIPSVPHLEALLLLRDAQAQAWSPEALARRLYIDPARASAILAELREQGLVASSDEGARFAPRDPALAVAVERLAETYAREVVEITQLIHSKTDRKAQQFADAFRIRREP